MTRYKVRITLQLPGSWINCYISRIVCAIWKLQILLVVCFLPIAIPWWIYINDLYLDFMFGRKLLLTSQLCYRQIARGLFIALFYVLVSLTTALCAIQRPLTVGPLSPVVLINSRAMIVIPHIRLPCHSYSIWRTFYEAYTLRFSVRFFEAT